MEYLHHVAKRGIRKGKIRMNKCTQTTKWEGKKKLV